MYGEIIPARVVKVMEENKLVKSIFMKPLKGIKKPKPGQFLMVWMPGYEEVPMSISGFFGGVVRISVAAVGETTERMHRVSVGEYLGFKGPLGNGIDVDDGTYLLVGGGYGVAPLVYALYEIKSAGGKGTMIIGARTKELLLFVDEASRYGEVLVSTDDGSYGYRGTAADLAVRLLERKYFDVVIVCGPEPLLINVARYCLDRKIECLVLAEAYMKCGIGLCGSCVLGNSGLQVCRDGPVLEARDYLRAINGSLKHKEW